MTPRPKRRTLAERDAQAIQTPPRKKEPHPRGNQRGVHVAEPTTATTTTRTTKATKRKSATQRRGAPATGRVIVNIWIDRTLWAQAKTLYLRAHPGHEVALVVGRRRHQRLPRQPPGRSHQRPHGGRGTDRQTHPHPSNQAESHRHSRGPLPARPGALPIRRHQCRPAPRRRQRRRQRRPRLPRPPAPRPAPTTMKERLERHAAYHCGPLLGGPVLRSAYPLEL